jgi:hypothetical protein
VGSSLAISKNAAIRAWSSDHFFLKGDIMIPSWIRWLFAFAGLYDFLIGGVFLFFGPELFDATGVPHPNHWGYIQFGALMLVVFGIMFFAVAYDPMANRNLMPYGMLLKISYTGLVAYYWAKTDLPMLFKPFAFIDAVMFVLFLVAYSKRLEPRNAPTM